jgi:hypothetical protein
MCITETVKLCHRDCEIVVGNVHFIVVMPPEFLKKLIILRFLLMCIYICVCLNVSCMCITDTVKLCHRDCEIVVGNVHFIVVIPPEFLKK